MARCRARFDIHEPNQKTHTCDGTQGHGVQNVPHHCPTCGSWWESGVGIVPDPRTPPDLAFETVLAFCECCTESGLRADIPYALVRSNHDPACPVRKEARRG